MRRRNKSVAGTLISLCVAALALVVSQVRQEPQPQEPSVVTGSGARDAKDVSPTAQEASSKGYELPAPVAGEIRLERVGYTVSYNKETREPNWVAWRLTRDHAQGRVKREGMTFAEDDDVPEPRALLADYYASGYDRGHMCPAADCKWSEEAMRQSFLLTNVCPQDQNLNRGEWNDVEQLCREWAVRYGEVYIACGPVFQGRSPRRRLGKGRVWVPDAFFKVVYCPSDGGKAIGFLYRNGDDRQTYDESVRSVDALEQLTGYDFFTALDDKVESRVEASADWNDW